MSSTKSNTIICNASNCIDKNEICGENNWIIFECNNCDYVKEEN